MTHLNILSGHELLFINTFFFSSIVFSMFIYKLFFDEAFDKTIENYKNLSIGNYINIFLIALFTISYTLLLLYDSSEKNNTPFLNSTFIKLTSLVIFLFLSGIFLFKEKYSFKQLVGVVLTIVSIYLVTSK